MIQSKASGKLYWAGEYAVVVPNNTAILKSVDKYLTVSITKSNGLGVINTGISNIPISWTYSDGKVKFNRDKEREYIYDTILVMSQYIIAKGITPICFDLDIKSELKDENNVKYGFGSSAAIVVAIVKAIAKLYNLNITKLEIFKLASIVSIMMGSNSSMGDIAAATYDSLIAYTSFDRNEIRKKIKTHSIYDLVNSKWKYLKIEELNNNLDMSCLVGWTSNMADSGEFVKKINRIKHTKNYKNFIKESKIVVENLVKAIEKNDIDEFKTNIERNRKLLSNLGIAAGLNIETVELRKLTSIANKYDEVAKLSGAGGGDCGVAFIFNKENVSKIENEWIENNIKSLGVIM